jgi:hypothetical protein
MKIFYHLTGSERKSLVAAVSQELNAPTKYLGAPSFSYRVGDYHIDKNGLLEGPDKSGLVADLQGLHNFIAATVEYDEPMTYEESLGGLGALETFEDLQLSESEELGLGKKPSEDWQGENGMQADDCIIDESDTLTIEMPLEGFTEESIANLEKLIASKAGLITKALGVDALTIERTGTMLRFPWFAFGTPGDDVAAFTRFIGALCAAAKKQQRVTARERLVENEKFAFRVFLIRLGFVGDDYKAARKILLRNLSGNSAFKTVPSTKETDDHE